MERYFSNNPTNSSRISNTENKQTERRIRFLLARQIVMPPPIPPETLSGIRGNLIMRFSFSPGQGRAISRISISRASPEHSKIWFPARGFNDPIRYVHRSSTRYHENLITQQHF
ncbi:hypothetical protein GWI33_012836 [Rhynchophorus ferrugineus]|uniref:Uncharacterized protein n=1 Tax=Rhynchophorus ferrugineus TaxID=354439 RepID=A0A834II22_RHYFE|nr:hypothetical protein GWI33_012836 [Rhynchophorus ferrugineus]